MPQPKGASERRPYPGLVVAFGEMQNGKLIQRGAQILDVIDERTLMLRILLPGGSDLEQRAKFAAELTDNCWTFLPIETTA
jgi:hypothetical protein